MKGPCQALFVQGSPKTFFCLLPNQNEKNYSCGTKGRIELKQGSKFELVHGLNVYKKKKYQFGPSKDPDRPFLCNNPLE